MVINHKEAILKILPTASPVSSQTGDDRDTRDPCHLSPKTILLLPLYELDSSWEFLLEPAAASAEPFLSYLQWPEFCEASFLTVEAKSMSPLDIPEGYLYILEPLWASSPEYFDNPFRVSATGRAGKSNGLKFGVAKGCELSFWPKPASTWSYNTKMSPSSPQTTHRSRPEDITTQLQGTMQLENIASPMIYFPFRYNCQQKSCTAW